MLSLDGRYVFYTRVDDAWRPHQVWRHEVGTPAEEDVLVFQEADARFWIGVGLLARRPLSWSSRAVPRLTTEVRLLDAADPAGSAGVVAPRREGVEYDVEPAGDRLLIVHNADNPDFDLARAPLDATGPEQWTLFARRAGGAHRSASRRSPGTWCVSLRA